MKKWLLVLFLLFCGLLCTINVLNAQSTGTRIDGSFAYSTDTAKKYSLYIPSTYTDTQEFKVFICMHPYDTNRWDAKSWCDTLVRWAETNQLILACPDGGEDGSILDPIDTGFATALMDSMKVWYTTRWDRYFVMGYDTGALAAYQWGINHHLSLRGILAVGAINYYGYEVDHIKWKAGGLSVFIIHGDKDLPVERFHPIWDTLQKQSACVDGKLLAGIGHTFDFPTRNEDLKDGYHYLDITECEDTVFTDTGNTGGGTSAIDELILMDLKVYPNPTQSKGTISWTPFEQAGEIVVRIYSMSGALVKEETAVADQLKIQDLNPGIYQLGFYTADGLKARARLSVFE